MKPCWRKMVSLLVIAALLPLALVARVSAEEDTTPPVLLSLSADKTAVGYPDTLTFTARVSDDTEVSSVDIYLASDSSGLLQINPTVTLKPAKEGLWTATWAIPAYLVRGNWWVDYVELSDSQNNWRPYYTRATDFTDYELTEQDYLPQEIRFTVNRSLTSAAVSVSQLALSSQIVKYGDSVNASLQLTTQLPVKAVQLWWDENLEEVYTCELTLQSGRYMGTLDTSRFSREEITQRPSVYALLEDETAYPLNGLVEPWDTLDLTIADFYPEITSITPVDGGTASPDAVEYEVTMSPGAGNNLAMEFHVFFVPEGKANRAFVFPAETVIHTETTQYFQVKDTYRVRVDRDGSEGPGYYLLTDVVMQSGYDGEQTYFTEEYQKAYLDRFGSHMLAVKTMPNAPKIAVRPDSTVAVVGGKHTPWLAMAGALAVVLLLAVPLIGLWKRRVFDPWRQRHAGRTAPDEDVDCIVIT